MPQGNEVLSVIYLSPIRSWRGATLSSMNEYKTMTGQDPKGAESKKATFF
jgi:hypothetical protein